MIAPFSQLNLGSVEHVWVEYHVAESNISSVADPGSGAFLPPRSGIRDGAMVGSRIRDKQTKFVNRLYIKKRGRIRDPVLFTPRIRDPEY
jgi:hypothetical protein